MRISESSRYTPVHYMEQSVMNQKQAGQYERFYGAATDINPATHQDIVVFSADDTQRVEEAQNQQQDAKTEIDEMNPLLESAKAQADADRESAEVKRKCLIIAARIIAGDEVPRKDHRYLAKHDLGLYCRAICMRVVREKARRHEANSDDESTKSNADSVPFGNKESSPSAAPAVQSDKSG